MSDQIVDDLARMNAGLGVIADDIIRLENAISENRNAAIDIQSAIEETDESLSAIIESTHRNVLGGIAYDIVISSAIALICKNLGGNTLLEKIRLETLVNSKCFIDDDNIREKVDSKIESILNNAESSLISLD